MSTYQLRPLDPLGDTSWIEVQFDSDAEAVAMAFNAKSNVAFQLWCGTVFLGHFEGSLAQPRTRRGGTAQG